MPPASQPWLGSLNQNRMEPLRNDLQTILWPFSFQFWVRLKPPLTSVFSQGPAPASSPQVRSHSSSWEREFLIQLILIFLPCFRPPEAVCVGDIPLGLKYARPAGRPRQVSHVISDPSPSPGPQPRPTNIALTCCAPNIFSLRLFWKIENLVCKQTLLSWYTKTFTELAGTLPLVCLEPHRTTWAIILIRGETQTLWRNNQNRQARC